MQLYPSVLPENDMLLFNLRCRKFIEMIPRHIMTFEEEDEEDEEVNSELENMTGGLVGDVSTATTSNYMTRSSLKAKKGKKRDLPEDEVEITRKRSELLLKASDASPFQGLGVVENALKYGQHLYDLYKDDPRQELKSKLIETFSILAYSDPCNSIMAPLLDPSSREPLANDINSAILGKLLPLLYHMTPNCLIFSSLARSAFFSATRKPVQTVCRRHSRITAQWTCPGYPCTSEGGLSSQVP
jgi:hypothetical protein